MATTFGDPGDDEPRLTPEQMETIRKALSNPGFLRQFKIAESTFSSLNRQITSSFMTGIAPTLERFRQQQRELAAAVAPMIATQVRLDLVMKPVVEQARAFQEDFAKQLRVSLIPNEQLQNRFQNLVVSSEFTEAMRRIRELSQVEMEIPAEDGFDRLAQLVASGEIDDETIGYAEEAIGSNQELSEAIDAAVDEFVKRRPLIPRKVVRAMIVCWVWLIYGGALYVIAVLTDPLIAAVPGSVGAPGAVDVAKQAGEQFDKRFPPEEDGPVDG